MDNNRCKAFLECAERGSITAAAEALGYTPSAISQLITAFEKDLGLRLLVRSQKGVTLTAEGSAIIPAVRAYLNIEHEIYQIASELKGVTTGKLSLAVYPSVATTWLPEVVRKFKNDYPKITINIMESIRTDIFRLFEQHKADIGIMAYSEPMPYEWIPLTDVPVIAAVPTDNPLSQGKAFPIKECENYDFIMGSWGNELEILSILKKNKLHPEVKYTTYDTPATLALVRMGLGISFVNELSARYYQNDNFVKLPIDPPQKITFGIVIPSREHMTNVSRKFLNYAVDYFKEEVL